MRILQCTKKFPFPVNDGESIAVLNLSRGLSEAGAEVVLFSLNTSKHYYELDKSAIPGELAHYRDIHPVFVNNDLSFFDALKAFYFRKAYHISRIDKPLVKAWIRHHLKTHTYDLIIFESSILVPYADLFADSCDAKLVLRAHNIEHRIWERLSRTGTNRLVAWYMKLSSRFLKKEEIRIMDKMDMIIPVSESDALFFTSLSKGPEVVVSGIGLDFDQYPYTESNRGDQLVLGFIGSLDWRPNLYGLKWLLTHVVSELKKSGVSFRLRVAGSQMPGELKKWEGFHVQLLGEVESAVKFYEGIDVLVVPLFAGSGTRVKILEAMAMGKLVITTTIGVEGIGATEGTHFLRADTKEAFVERIMLAFRNPEICVTIGKNSREFIQKNYSYQDLANNLYELFGKLVAEA